MSFARKFGDKYGKKLIDTTAKTGIDAAKAALKREFQKTTEATGDLTGNKIADKITSIGKPKEKEKTKEIEEIYIPPEKRQQVIDDSRLFWIQHIKTEFQKNVNFLNTNSDENLPRFITKKWVEVYDQSGGNYNAKKEIRIKTSMLRSDLCDFSDAYIVVKGDIALEGDNDTNKRNKNLAFKNNAPFINCI